MEKNLFSRFFYSSFCLVTLFVLTSCTSLNQRMQTREGAQLQNSENQRSLLATLFGNEESESANHRVHLPTNTNLQPELNRLPTSIQPPPQRYTTLDISPYSPLNLTHIEGNTWRTAANPAVVYGIVARILAQTYIIVSTDRKNFNIQTDWDKFFIDGRLFRNRMSVNVFPVGTRQTEVVIKNSVEYFTGTLAKQEENTAWLPSPDLTDEIKKLVETTDRQTMYAYSQNMLRN